MDVQEIKVRVLVMKREGEPRTRLSLCPFTRLFDSTRKLIPYPYRVTDFYEYRVL